MIFDQILLYLNINNFKYNKNMKKKTWSEQEIIALKKEKDENGLTNKQLTEKYGIDVNYYFRKFGLTKHRNRQSDRKQILYKFDSISNEFEAYLLGFIMADGSVSTGTGCLKIKLKNDPDGQLLLTQVKNYISPESPISITDKIVEIKIYCQELTDNLINKFGVVPNKTYIGLKFPNIDESLYRHFIRGYFDADGTVFYDRKYLKSNICSIDENFLLEIQKILDIEQIDNRINVEIRQGKLLKTPSGTESTSFKNMYRLYVSKKEALSKFKKYLYENSNYFFKRKFNIFHKEDNIELT